MAKTIIIIGTLDTKGEEVKYVKGLIERRGQKTIVIDVGVLGEPAFPPDFHHEQVAEAGGATLKELIAYHNEGKALAVMATGASRILHQLYSGGKFDGIIALGGSMGTAVGLSVMRSLPIGMPKLMVSTVAFHPIITPLDVSPDQVMMQSFTDMWGLDPMTEKTLDKAAAAISAMAETYERGEISKKPVIGVTTLGTAVCKYAWQVRALLRQMGYEVAVFHTVGIGGRSFEQLIEEGLIAGALDLGMHELACHVCGGLCDAGPSRLEAAGKVGIPQVVAPGALGFLCWAGRPETLPPHWRNRRTYSHTPEDTLPEMTEQEMAAVGKVIAQKLNRATGPAAVIMPLGGVSEWDKPGAVFYNPAGRKAFLEALKEHIEPKVEVIELDMHINDPEFAEQAVAILDGMMKGKYKA